jgi:hypothetical protein
MKGGDQRVHRQGQTRTATAAGFLAIRRGLIIDLPPIRHYPAIGESMAIV